MQVRRKGRTPSNSEEAMRRGAACIGEKGKMFAFNPGKQQKVFPDYNPYTISRCSSCSKANLKLGAGIPDNELCKVCNTLHSLMDGIPEADKYESLHNGSVLVSPYHGLEEKKATVEIAKKVSDLLGKKIYLLPRLDSNTAEQLNMRKRLLPEGIIGRKNPDFYDGLLLYDGKSLLKSKAITSKQQRNVINNHIKTAKQQADNFVFEIPDSFDKNVIDSTIKGYLKSSGKDRTIIVFWKGEGYIYKK